LKLRTFLVIATVSLALEILIASQLYPKFSPTVATNNKIFSLRDQEDPKEDLNVNVLNSTFRVSESILSVSAKRGPDDRARSIYDVYFSLNVPFESGLRLKFSVLASQVNLTTDSARIYLTLINGTDTILLFYVVGFKMQNLVPDPTAETYFYVFYQVGNATDTWFVGERNLWTDLASRGLSIDSSWKIVKIVFGVESLKETSTPNSQMQGLFELTENSIYYENLTFATVSPSDEQISWIAVAVMITIVFLFGFVSYTSTARETMTETSLRN